MDGSPKRTKVAYVVSIYVRMTDDVGRFVNIETKIDSEEELSLHPVDLLQADARYFRPGLISVGVTSFRSAYAITVYNGCDAHSSRNLFAIMRAAIATRYSLPD